MAMAAASFDCPVSVLFVYAGIRQLRRSAYAGEWGVKADTRPFAAMSDFGIDNIYVSKNSLLANNLGESDLVINAISLDNGEIEELIARHDRVFTF